jgi:hypothetical protein
MTSGAFVRVIPRRAREPVVDRKIALCWGYSSHLQHANTGGSNGIGATAEIVGESRHAVKNYR